MDRFKILLLALALVLASGVVFQSLTGHAIFGRGQELRQLWSTDGGVAGVLRSTTPGMFLMAGALLYLLAAYAKEQIRRPILLGGLCAILCAGTLVGFGRGMWLSIVVGVLILAFFSRRTAYARLTMAVGAIGLTLFSALLVAKPDYVIAISDRFLSVGKELESGKSFGRRTEENFFAFQKIVESPILGVGLGGRYKPENSESLTWPEQARYIHNSYMKVAVKMGVPGLIIVIVLIGFMLKRTWSTVTINTDDPALAFAAAWVILTTTIFTSPTQPNFVASNGVATIALAIFLSESLRLKYR